MGFADDTSVATSSPRAAATPEDGDATVDEAAAPYPADAMAATERIQLSAEKEAEEASSAAAASENATKGGGNQVSDLVAEEGSGDAAAEGATAAGAADGNGSSRSNGVMVDGTVVPAAAPSDAAPNGNRADILDGVTLDVDDQIDLPSPIESMPGFVPRATPHSLPHSLPGAYRIGIDTGEGRPQAPMSNDDDENETETETAMTAMTTATLVQNGAVADATAVDVEAERAEKDRLHREVEELRRRVAKDKHDGGNTETKEGSPLPWSGKASRQCRIYAAVTVVCSVAVAGIVGGVLGARGRSEGGRDGSSSSDAFDDGKDNSFPDTGKENSSADATASARLDAMKAIVATLSEEDAFDDEEGPNFAALDWIANVDAAQLPADDAEIEWRVQQRYILALLYFSTGGDDWDEGFDFLSEDNECKWLELRNRDFGTTADTVYPEGTFCDNKGRVERIGLWWNNLSGTLPHELSNLDRLTTINLPGNNLSGPIPSKFGQLTNLKQLFLNENCLSGTVPESLSELPNLEMVELVGNKDLTGSLNGFCNGTEYKGNLFHFTANCGTCPNSPSLVQCDCCVCCDLVTYNCCDKEGNRLWNHANIGLNAAGQPSSFDKPCLSKDTLAYYLDHKDDLLWITDGRGGGWI